MLLRIRNLSVTFTTPNGSFQALNDIDLDVNEQETLAIVGESGCGKSVLSYAALGLLHDMAEVSGSVQILGKEIRLLTNGELQDVRGGTIALVPQNPSLSFDPVVKVGEQIREFIEKTGIEKGGDARRRALEFLALAGFSDPAGVYRAYSHRLSGGMCEMALIAMAAAVEPKLLIADEPTKGLDMLVRRQILSLLHSMATGASLIMITHDIGAAATCKRIAVMYAGEIVEQGPAVEVLESPLHYYTRGLLNAHPGKGMKPIRAGSPFPPGADHGCRFRSRCEVADAHCESAPPWRDFGGRRKVRCHHA